MIDIDKNLMAYFRELSPHDRRIMFEKIDAAGEIDENVRDFCMLVYNERYTDDKKSESKIDNWLWKIVYLPGLFRKRKFFRGAVKRETAATLADLHLSDAESVDEMESTILYLEYRNAAKRYLSTCSSPGYGSSFMGLSKATDEQKKIQACEDLWMASRGFAIVSGEEDNLRLWCNALHDELKQYDSSVMSYYEELEKKYVK